MLGPAPAFGRTRAAVVIHLFAGSQPDATEEEMAEQLAIRPPVGVPDEPVICALKGRRLSESGPPANASGRTELTRSVPIALFLALYVILLPMLAACGSEKGAQDTRLPLQRVPENARVEQNSGYQAPVVFQGREFHIGADVAPEAGIHTPTVRHGNVKVLHGTLSDGVGAMELIAYLSADAKEAGTLDHAGFPDLILRFGITPPTVRIAAGATAAMIDETVRAVQLINAALPGHWQLRVDSKAGPDVSTAPLPGGILAKFAPREAWPVVPDAVDTLGQARWFTASPSDDAVTSGTILEAEIFIDHTRVKGESRLHVLVHELIHALGRGHADPRWFPDTIMVSRGDILNPGHILYPLDREALLAVYGKLAPGDNSDDIAGKLDSWSDTSIHVHGEMTQERVAFGVALRNGLTQPWAVGTAPFVNLAENDLLSGSVTWTGRLLGLTPRAEPVAAAAGLTIDLATLDGNLALTNLESWTANVPPGAIGTGGLWGDGDLTYTVEVRGNVFTQTGGDEGTVTGAFFGSAHEAMGGVVQRHDFSGSFGGHR